MIARALFITLALCGFLAADEVTNRLDEIGDPGEASKPEQVESEQVESEQVEVPDGGGSQAIEAPPADEAGYGVPFGPLTLSGNLYQRYRFRRTGAGSDQDLFGYFNLDATYPPDDEEGTRPYRKLGFNLQGSYNLDIDGFQSSGSAAQRSSFVPFLDITNTFSDRFRGFVHSAYGEVEDIWALESFKVGRQQIYREFGLFFDGAYARTKRWNTLAFDVYGGVPTDLYESSASGDALVGFGTDSKPLPGLTLGADIYYVKDRSDFVSDDENFVYLVRGRYDIDHEWSFGGSASWVDTRDRRQVVDVRYNSEDWGLTGSLRVVRQNAVVEFQSSEISPYVVIMGKYAPYYQYQLDLYQPLGEKYGIGGGMNLRHLENSSDEGLYNHDFRNVYLSFTATELWTGARATVQGDLWDSDGDDIYSVGFELEQKVKDLLRIRLGTSYHLYRIDLFTGDERERDRVYYAKFRWHLTPRLDLDTDYQYERDSITEYHTVTAGLGLWF